MVILAERSRLGNYDERHCEENFCEIILNLDQWFRRTCCLKYFLSRALAVMLYRAERNHLGNFGRGPIEEHSCEIILKLAQ